MRVLLTRPASDSAALAQVLAERGHHCSVAPVFMVKNCAWSPACLEGAQAVLLSSRNAARNLQHAWSLPRDLRIFAVGPATAAEAIALGFHNVEAAAGTANSLLTLVRRRLAPAGGRIVYLSGAVVSRDLTADLRRDRYSADRVVVYRTIPATRLPASVANDIRLGTIDVGLFLSRQTAVIFRGLMRAMNMDPCCGSMRALAVSAKVAEALRPLPWRLLGHAPEPSLASVIAALERLEAGRPGR